MNEQSKDEAEKGNFIAFINPKKDIDDNRPAFQGNLSLPGQDAKRSVALWAYTTDKGDIILNGKAGDSPTAQIAKFTKPPKEMAEQALRRSAEGCTHCHGKYRDVPQKQ